MSEQKAAEDRATAAERALSEWLATPIDSREAVTRALRSAGELCALGTAPTAASGVSAEILRGAIASGLGLDEVRDAGHALLDVLDRLDGADDLREPSQAEADDAEVRRIMGIRDGAAFVMLGAKALAGAGVPHAESDVLGVTTFDELVRPEIARLTRFNGVRGEVDTAIAAPLHAKFWWRFEGRGIEPGAWDALPAVAALVTRFPAARRRLESLMAVEEHLTTSARSPVVVASSKVVSLREWLVARSRADAARSGKIAAAAADEEERLVHFDDCVEIAWLPPDELVLYILDESLLTTTPQVELPGGTRLQADRTPRSVGRYSVTLVEGALDALELHVRLTLHTGLHDVRLPPEGS